jgi:hypothetical protein
VKAGIKMLICFACVARVQLMFINIAFGFDSDFDGMRSICELCFSGHNTEVSCRDVMGQNIYSAQGRTRYIIS